MEFIEQEQAKDTQFIDLIQTDPNSFNKSQQQKQKEYEQKFGKDKLHQILYSHDHHELKSRRSKDYRLSDSELAHLHKHKVYMKSYSNDRNPSFGRHISSLYTNDMPVFITSDMMLYALHNFYDKSLEILEENLINEFKTLCFNLINVLHSIDITKTSNTTLQEHLKGFELYLMVPYFILHLEEVINNTNRFGRSYRDVPAPKTYRIGKTLLKPKYNTMDEINKIVDQIRNQSIGNLQINNVNFTLDGSTFKPRGHYDKSVQLMSYFMAFTWFSKVIVKLNKSNVEEYKNGLIFALGLANIGEKILPEIHKIEHFVETLIGEPDGYTLSSFLNEFNKFSNSPKLLPEFFEWLMTETTIDNLVDTLTLTKNCQLGKYGDTGLSFNQEGASTEYCFSLIGKGTTFDNAVIDSMIDKKFYNATNQQRKYASIFDITYAVFGNESTLELAKRRMTNNSSSDDFKENRDGLDYEEYLIKTKNDIDNLKIVASTLYQQELVMLRALSRSSDIEPFNSVAWNLKQAQTQIGHYSEVRHDNVLYLEECGGLMLCCEHPDIMIEPCTEFWNEFLKLVNMMSNLFSSLNANNNRTRQIINNFSSIVNKFLQFLDFYNNGMNVPEELKRELMCILEYRSGGSGPPTYDGWYPQLFYDQADSLDAKYEASSYCTGAPDDRDNGGICHLGNGNVQLLYIIVNNKAFIGPVYEMYDIITEYPKRYTDTEWESEYKKYKPLNFNV
jgi:hypothetical protein